MFLRTKEKSGSIVQNINARGFTIPEVIVAGSIMIILCVGTMTAYVQAIKLNRGNNLRMQALAVLQLEVEFYRSLKFVPVGTDNLLNAGTFTNVRTRQSADGRVFNISVVIEDLQTAANGTPTFKEINISAVPQIAETEGWLQNLNTQVTVQRVRSN